MGVQPAAHGALEERGIVPGEAPPGGGYLRLRREKYDARALRKWADLVGAQAWTDAWVFFKHEDAGAGPKLAAKFQALV